MTTIFALASAHGRSGVNVLRLSGSKVAEVVAWLCQPSRLPVPRLASLRKIIHPENGVLIDKALVLYFPAPHSFTGEDVLEIHLHGGRAILQAVTSLLVSLADVRLAEPGEFTRRAFENGKMDLTEAEAIADLVDAETEAQRRQAMRQFEGALGSLCTEWADRLKRCLAHSEACIDFSDEELPADLEAKQVAIIQSLQSEMAAHLNDKGRGEKLREGFMVAILGAPNAGKSSLLNALAQREAAIVSPIAGTTRDVIEVHLDLGGYPVTLADTAGLREEADTIESEGIKRALARATQADLKILLFDGTCPKDAATLALADADTLCVVNKIDLAQGLVAEEGPLFVSTKTGEGLAVLSAALIRAIEDRYAVTASPVLTRARHRAALHDCADHLQRALGACEAALRAEDLRLAMRALGSITGKVGVEDLLDTIFRDFCIGK